MKHEYRKPGQFCWTDLMTTDVKGTKEFTQKLFGWNFVDVPESKGAMTIAKLGEYEMASICDANAPIMPKGTKSHIGNFVAVENIDDTIRAVTTAGGKVVEEPSDLMDLARIATIADPTGANVSLWQAKKHRGISTEMTTLGAPSWIELISNNVDLAGSFYTKVFDWQPSPMNMGSYTYITFKKGDLSICGMMAKTKGMEAMVPQWGTYFTVANCDDSVHKAKKLGASVVVMPQDVPKVGRFAVLETPQGLPMNLIQYKM